MSSKSKKKFRSSGKVSSGPDAAAGSRQDNAPRKDTPPSPAAAGSTLPASSRRPVLPWLGFVMVLLASITWVLTHAYLVDAVTTRLCNHFDANIAPEKRMPVFLSEIAFDGYVWNRHAENLGRDGNWRLRFSDFDNAPAGREVHWNSAFAWYLRGLGEMHYALTSSEPGASLRNSIFRMSIWANPILLVVALVLFSSLTALRFGALSGSVIAIGMVSVQTFYEGFSPAYPDHHGLISFCLLGLLFGIAWAGAGWVRAPHSRSFVLPATEKQAEHGIIFSAVCGAMGLWFSALSTSMVLGTIGIAAVATTPFFLQSGRKSGAVFHPHIWKLWALWGSGATMFFYLLEYFPNHFSMRLEVNHPLYALAYLGGGWAIYVLAKWFAARPSARFPWRTLIACALACAALPAAIIIGGAAVYVPGDAFMDGLWKYIAELLPLLVRIQSGDLTFQIAFGWFPLLLLAAGVLLFSRRLDAGTKAVLLFMAVPILLLTGIQFYQVRWGLLVGPLYIALAGIVIPVLWSVVPADKTSRGIAAGLFLAFGWLVIVPGFHNSFRNVIAQYQAEPGNIPISPGQGLALLHRQMALAIRENANGREVVLLSSPNSSCILSAMGGFRTIGTLYWENVDGLKHAARALNAQNDQEARALLEKHGVTHVSLMTWENFIEPFFNILYRNPEGKTGTFPTPPGTAPAAGIDMQKSVDASFGLNALFKKTIPDYMRPILFPTNDLMKGLNQTVLLLEFAPQQTREEALLHVARYAWRIENNPVLAEFTLRDLVASPTVGLDASAELALLYLSQKREKDAMAMFQNVMASPDPKIREQAAVLALQVPGSSASLDTTAAVMELAAGQPDATADTLLNAAWFFATMPDVAKRSPQRAAELLDRLALISPEPTPQANLVHAAAEAAAGNFDRAIEFAKLSASANDPSTRNTAEKMIDVFAAGQPWLPAQAGQ